MADAIKIIKDDHKMVAELFTKYKDLGDQAYVTKQETADQIMNALTEHAEMEETILYPKMKEKFSNEDDKMVAEAYAEHDVLKNLISEIKGLTPQDEEFDAKITVLDENVTHHVKEEEEELLPMAKKEFEPEELEALGDEMMEFKEGADVA